MCQSNPEKLCVTYEGSQFGEIDVFVNSKSVFSDLLREIPQNGIRFCLKKDISKGTINMSYKDIQQITTSFPQDVDHLQDITQERTKSKCIFCGQSLAHIYTNVNKSQELTLVTHPECIITFATECRHILQTHTSDILSYSI